MTSSPPQVVRKCNQCGHSHEVWYPGNPSQHDCQRKPLRCRHGHIEGMMKDSHAMRDISSVLVEYWNLPQDRWSSGRRSAYQRLLDLWNHDKTLSQVFWPRTEVGNKLFAILDDLFFDSRLQSQAQLVMIDDWPNGLVGYQGITGWPSHSQAGKIDVVISRQLLDPLVRDNVILRRRLMFSTFVHEMLHAALTTLTCKCNSCNSLEPLINTAGLTGHGPHFTMLGNALTNQVKALPVYSNDWVPDPLQIALSAKNEVAEARGVWEKYRPKLPLPRALRDPSPESKDGDRADSRLSRRESSRRSQSHADKPPRAGSQKVGSSSRRDSSVKRSHSVAKKGEDKSGSRKPTSRK